tara:strand:- start:35171 stop:35497 length:327 start_codon:yes stop_codon:yes gene_type:complete
MIHDYRPHHQQFYSDKRTERPGQLQLKDILAMKPGTLIDDMHGELSRLLKFISVEEGDRGKIIKAKYLEGVLFGLETSLHTTDMGMEPYSNGKWNSLNWIRLHTKEKS